MAWINFAVAVIVLGCWMKWTSEERMPYWLTVVMLGMAGLNFLMGVKTL